jgi:hypothetical protein
MMVDNEQKAQPAGLPVAHRALSPITRPTLHAACFNHHYHGANDNTG